MKTDIGPATSRAYDRMIQRLSEAEQKPMAAHVREWEQDMRRRGVTGKHVEQMILYANRILSMFPSIADIDEQGVRAETQRYKAKGKSLETVNRMLRAAKAFTRWLHHGGRLPADPLLGVRFYNAALDRRHDRRALSDTEVEKLIATTAASRDFYYGMRGAERAWMYRLAVSTGLRAGELRKLTANHFDLKAVPPVVKLSAKETKNKRGAVIPLRADLAAALKPWLARYQQSGVSPTQPLFPIHQWAKTADMLRHDLAAAGIPYVDGGLYADFHALRHTFCTRLARGRTGLKVLQQLARHSDPRLTIGRYAHADLSEGAAALEALPGLEAQP